MKNIELAEKHRRHMQAALEPLNKKLQKLLEDDAVQIFYQASDGWVVLFRDCYNTPVHFLDMERLLKMTKEEALNYLMSETV